MDHSLNSAKTTGTELSNEDPITGLPGAHSMGTGLGAALALK